MEVRREGAVVRVSHRRGRGLAVGVASSSPSTARTLADARVGAGAGRLERQLLWRDGAGVQQARHRPIQLLQQHLWEEQEEEEVLTLSNDPGLQLNNNFI